MTSFGSCSLARRSVGKLSCVAQLRIFAEVDDDNTDQDGAEDDDEEDEKDEPTLIDAIIVVDVCG